MLVLERLRELGSAFVRMDAAAEEFIRCEGGRGGHRSVSAYAVPQSVSAVSA